MLVEMPVRCIFNLFDCCWLLLMCNTSSLVVFDTSVILALSMLHRFRSIDFGYLFQLTELIVALSVS
jgi:hypothetical protein